LPKKAVLLLYNVSAHPNENVLKSDNVKLSVKDLPPNVTTLIQPMDQGTIATTERHYRQHVDKSNDLKMFLKKLFVGCHYMTCHMPGI
jgi:hypothetical protein